MAERILVYRVVWPFGLTSTGEVQLLGLAFTLTDQFPFGPDTLKQHLPSGIVQGEYLTWRGYCDSGDSTHYTFDYQANLDAVSRIDVEVQMNAAWFNEVNKIILAFLYNDLAAHWDQLQFTPEPTWRRGLRDEMNWPPSEAQFVCVEAAPAPQFQATTAPASTRGIVPLIAIGLALFLALGGWGVIQSTGWNLGPISLPTAVWPIPAPQTEHFPLGCPGRPQVDCGSAPIKGIVFSEQVRLYFLSTHSDYETTPFDANRGDRWFCTTSAAEDNGFQRAR